MNERHIVTVDLGSSKIAVAVTKVDDDQEQIIYYKTHPSEGISHSEIFNLAKLANCLDSALGLAEKELGLKINQVIVGLPKYKIRCEKTSYIYNSRTENVCITEDEMLNYSRIAIDTFSQDNLEDSEAIFSAIPQAFSADDKINLRKDDLIGMDAKEINGVFNVYIGKKKALRDIDNTFNLINRTVAKKYFTPELTSNSVLKDAEKNSGTALIEIGGGVSSVTIVKDGILRYYYSMPFGGKSITKDIQSEVIYTTEELIEEIKLEYGACMPEKLLNIGDKVLRITLNNLETPIDISCKYISEIITARAKEIIDTLLYKVQESGYADKLSGGIVITGGGANLTNLSNYIKSLSGFNVRVGYPKTNIIISGCKGIYDTAASATLGLISAARNESKLSCTDEIKFKTPIEVEEDVPIETEDTVFNPAEVEKEPAEPKEKPKPKAPNAFSKSFAKLRQGFGNMFDEIGKQDNENSEDE